jgi:hypothetical protein
METIKLLGSGSAIINLVGKQETVSCSCCGGCCMYPASRFNEAFNHDDLPDVLSVFFDFGGPFPTYKLEEPVIVDNFYYPELTGISVHYGDPIQLQDILTPYSIGYINGQWMTGIDYIPAFFECLAEDGPEPTYQPNFSNEYLLIHPDGSGRLLRSGFCKWEGMDENGLPIRLDYVGPFPSLNLKPSEFHYQWRITYYLRRVDDIQVAIKTSGTSGKGIHNNPVGIYNEILNDMISSITEIL